MTELGPLNWITTTYRISSSLKTKRIVVTVTCRVLTSYIAFRAVSSDFTHAHLLADGSEGCLLKGIFSCWMTPLGGGGLDLM